MNTIESTGPLLIEVRTEAMPDVPAGKVRVTCVRYETLEMARGDFDRTTFRIHDAGHPTAFLVADAVAHGCPHNGAWSIAQERRRQIEKKGFTDEHDDDHTTGELAQAAECYVSVAGAQAKGISAIGDPGPVWPWFRRDWKPSEDPIRNLEKAGALIAAEIDRLRRLAERETKS